MTTSRCYVSGRSQQHGQPLRGRDQGRQGPAGTLGVVRRCQGSLKSRFTEVFVVVSDDMATSVSQCVLGTRPRIERLGACLVLLPRLRRERADGSGATASVAQWERRGEEGGS